MLTFPKFNCSRHTYSFNKPLPGQGLNGCVGGIAREGEREASHIARITGIIARNGDGITSQGDVGEAVGA